MIRRSVKIFFTVISLLAAATFLLAAPGAWATHEADHRYAVRDQTNPFTFDLRALMLWTTVIALGFGFVQFGRAQWRWTAAVADWEFLGVMPMIGVFNALLGLLWLCDHGDTHRDSHNHRSTHHDDRRDAHRPHNSREPRAESVQLAT